MQRVAAIIATYNRAEMLRECIELLLTQSHPIQELIVVNDGSTDATENVVKCYDDRVTLITKENGGKATALNLALKSCAADYVWICDDDDVAAPDGLEHLAAALDSNAAVGFSYGTFKIFRDDPSGRSFMPPSYLVREGESNVHIQFLEEMFTFQFAMLVRRSLYDEMGPFREDFLRSQDHEMAIRLARNAQSVYVPHVIFYQRAHSGQRGTLANTFSTTLNAKKWLKYEQKMMASIRKEYNLNEFTPTFARDWDGLRAARAALVERACISAKCGLWDEAIEDFREAGGLCATPAATEEVRLAEAVVRKPLPWDILSQNPAWLSDLRAVHRRSEYARSILQATCRPLGWQAHAMI